jgi:hypothetical protein
MNFPARVPDTQIEQLQSFQERLRSSNSLEWESSA